MHLFTTRFYTCLIVVFGPQLNRIRLKAKTFCFITTASLCTGMLAQNNYITLHFSREGNVAFNPPLLIKICLNQIITLSTHNACMAATL